MPIQKESKLYTQLVVPPPRTEQELPQWAANMSRAFEELLHQVFEKFNAHVTGNYSHPDSWASLRIPRPRFYSLADSSQVIVPATAAIPARFVIDGEPFEITSDLTMDLDTAGVGGLRVGLTKAANTAYYLYGVKNDGTVALLADTSAPATGPTGYAVWTYLGAFATDQSSALILPFQSHNGVYLSEESVESEAHTGDTSSTAKAFSSLPTTAMAAYVNLAVSGSAAGQSGRCTGRSSTTDDGIVQVSQVASVNVFNHGWVPVLEAQTLYLRASAAAATVTAAIQGWMEDPTEYT